MKLIIIKIYKKLKTIKNSFMLFIKTLPPKKIRLYIKQKNFKMPDQHYKNLRNVILEDGNSLLIKRDKEINKRIAVHVHLYYVDLLNDIIMYLNNIPFKFDVFVSVSSETNINYVKRKFKKIAYTNKVYVNACENVGRDFGPMFFAYGKYIKNYDYLLHIHTKKSLRTGEEQNNWRNYLYANLLGEPQLVSDYINLMIEHNVGVCYPASYNIIPCWGHTWLQSFEIAKKFANWLDIKDEYLPFSPGSMFWCKVDALRQIFDMNLKAEDFGEEAGQDEGTLAHVMERITGINSLYNNYAYAVFYPSSKSFMLNYDDYNFYYDYTMTLQNALQKCIKYDVVSFGLFGTLLNSPLFDFGSYIKFLDIFIAKKMNCDIGLFSSYWEDSVLSLEKKFINKKTFSLDDIYSEMMSLYNLNYSEIEKIRNLQLDWEIKNNRTRLDVVKLLRILKSLGKTINIVSDTFYSKSEIHKILKYFDIDVFDNIVLMSETGLNKSSFKLWRYYFEKFTKNSTFIHVGSDETRDINYFAKCCNPQVYLISSNMLYKTTRVFNGYPQTMEELLFQGIVNNFGYLNSPFSLSDNLRINISNYFSLGYSIFAPLFYLLIRGIRHNDSNVIIDNAIYNSDIFKYIWINLFGDSSMEELEIWKNKEKKLNYVIQDRYAQFLLAHSNISLLQNKEQTESILEGIANFYNDLKIIFGCFCKNVFDLDISEKFIVNLFKNIIDGTVYDLGKG